MLTMLDEPDKRLTGTRKGFSSAPPDGLASGKCNDAFASREAVPRALRKLSITSFGVQASA